ncbi:MAG: GntR family transcriptional regulator [Candidatus Omnitrophota bacterium]
MTDSNGPDKTQLLQAHVGTCDYLEVVSVIDSGAFLYCGLSKDIFVPVGEQLKIMKVGERHVVYIYRDEGTGRIAASSRLNKYIYDEAPDNWCDGDAVDILVSVKTDMGYKAIVNHDSWGLLYENEIFQPLSPGQKLHGFIKKIRPDRRIDLCLQKAGYQGVMDLSEQIINHLTSSGGCCAFTDKTPPQEIHALFGVSKKKFKMAIGSLFKQKKILIMPDGIKLVISNG